MKINLNNYTLLDEDYYIDAVFDFADIKNIIIDLDYNSEITNENGIIRRIQNSIKG